MVRCRPFVNVGLFAVSELRASKETNTPSAIRIGSDAARKATGQDSSPASVLEKLGHQAILVAKTARKHGKGLRGDNFYGNKLAELRADATNTFRQLVSRSVGDSSALAELVQIVFGSDTGYAKRLEASRDLVVALRTTWREVPSTAGVDDSDLFPLSILSQARRGYLVTIGRQMNGCYRAGWCDSAGVMMRRLLEIAIIEAFEAKKIAAKITGGDGNYVQLSDLITRALAEASWKLSRNATKYLPQLRDLDAAGPP